MKIALFGLTLHQDFIPKLNAILHYLEQKQIELLIYEPLYDLLKNKYKCLKKEYVAYSGHEDLDSKVQFVFSIGGDGAFLQSIRYVRSKNIPIVGINTGRLGFLADVSEDTMLFSLENIIQGNYHIEERSLLELTCNVPLLNDFHYALNEATVHKMQTSSMIKIHAFINQHYLSTYWSDGIIVSTPTGSTAYSLSAGGPILTPDAKNFIITPIAPHHLTVRPIVIPDHYEIILKVEEEAQYMVSLDFRSESIATGAEIHIKKAPFKVRTIRLEEQHFFDTLRDKLMWGADKRN
jgi:NAD+ kinase